MHNGLQVFNLEKDFFDIEKAKAVLDRSLDPNLIKKRKQGNTELSYIGGHTVIRLLNEAFGLKWSFEIVTEEVVASIPKPFTEWNNKTRKKENVYNPDGSLKMEPQPPVAKVLGRLTVPGLGVKEQYGSKVLIGGASEQESAFKAASTDAMKKCASLFGIGLELYESEEEREVYSQTAHAVQPTQPTEQTQQTQSTHLEIAQEFTQVSTQQVYQPVTKQAEVATPQTNPNQWQQADIDKLKELKTILGITDNPQLDPYVREFMDRQDVTYMNIIPTNVKAFNVFLSKKVQNV